MKSVVVTGASSGIGWGIVAALTGKGMHVFAGVRAQADADRLSGAFKNVTPIICDVTDEASLRRGADLVRAALNGRTLSGLVNNAGIAVPGPFLHQPLADYRKQIEVNLVGAFSVTQAFAPLLGADQSLQGAPGRIVNITSLGGKIGSPLLGGYCSAKHGLEGFSESLRRELMLYGIDVIIVGPGAVKTPIWDKALGGARDYADTDFAHAMKQLTAFMGRAASSGLGVERVGEVVHRALTTARPRVRYALAPSLILDWVIPRALPRRWVDALFARRLGLTRRHEPARPPVPR